MTIIYRVKKELALIRGFWICTFYFSMVAGVLIGGGCASPTVVQTVKPGDSGLTCPQLLNEYSDAERFRNEAEKEKTITGGNVARALPFWPAILGTAANANEAIGAANTRKVHLANVMNSKGCQIPTEALTEPAKP